MKISQNPKGQKIIYKKNIPSNMYQCNQINYQENEDINDYNQNNHEYEEDEEHSNNNNIQNDEEEYYEEDEGENEEEDENNIPNENQNKYYRQKNPNINQNENMMNNNNDKDIAMPKYYRNNPLVYKGDILKKKIHRNLREENPLKSVAQKICNIVIKGDKSNKDKNKTNNINAKKEPDLNAFEDNEEFEDNEQYEEEEDLSQNENEEYEEQEENEEINDEDEQGVEDIQDLEQEENEEFDEQEENEEDNVDEIKYPQYNKKIMKENEKINDNTMKPIKINVKEKQNKPQVPQSQNKEKNLEKPTINNFIKNRNINTDKKVNNMDNNINQLKIKDTINKIKGNRPITLAPEYKIIEEKKSEPKKEIDKNNFSQQKPIKVNVNKTINNDLTINTLETEKDEKEEKEQNKINEVKKEENKKNKISPKKIYSYNQKQISDNSTQKNHVAFSNEKIKNYISMFNKSDTNSKENKNINNVSQKWNKINEIKNIKRNIISNKKDTTKISSSAIINKNYNTLKPSISTTEKKLEVKPQPKNMTTTPILYSNKTEKQPQSKLLPDLNKKENIVKNNTQNNFGNNKPYKTLTYTSSNKENLNTGRSGTSIIITSSSRVNEDKNDPSNKGKIHHMVTVRTFNNGNNRSSSTSKNNDKSGKNSLNITNNNYKNRTITIISSNEDIEIGRENDRNNIGRANVSNYNLRNKNNLKDNNNSIKSNKYIRTEPNENKKYENIINTRKEENKIDGRNYTSSVLNSNPSNERKNYFPNNNDNIYISNTKKNNDTNIRYSYKLSSSEVKKNINRANINDNKNNLNNSNKKNNANNNHNINNTNNINTVFISSYTSKKRRDNNSEQAKINTNNRVLYNSTNLSLNKINNKPEIKTNKETKEIKDISKSKNISITSSINNNTKINNSINTTSNKIESKKENIIETVNNNLKDKTNNLEENKNEILKPIINPEINELGVGPEIKKEEPKVNIDINKTTENNDNNLLNEDIDINTDLIGLSSHIDYTNDNKFEYLKYLSRTNDISNLFQNNLNLALNNAIEYDLLNNPELSDFTKEYLASHTSGYRPELNAYTKAYLNSLSNDDNATKPELTSLTKEYLSNNFLLNENIDKTKNEK